MAHRSKFTLEHRLRIMVSPRLSGEARKVEMAKLMANPQEFDRMFNRKVWWLRRGRTLRRR